MRALEPWHLIVLVLVVAVLFGGKRLPDVAKGLGSSLRIFRKEVREMKAEDQSAPRPRPVQAEHPLEGRVMPNEPSRTDEARRDA